MFKGANATSLFVEGVRMFLPSPLTHFHYIQALSSFVDKEGAGNCDVLMRLVGKDEPADEDASACTVLVLLAAAKGSPKVQYYVRVKLVDDPDCVLFADKPYPYEVQIATRPPLLPGNDGEGAGSVADLMTSDDLSWLCLASRSRWKIQRMNYDMVCGVDSLLFMRVTGHNEPIAEHPAKRRANAPKAKAKAFALPPELDYDDPGSAACVFAPQFRPRRVLPHRTLALGARPIVEKAEHDKGEGAMPPADSDHEGLPEHLAADMDDDIIYGLDVHELDEHDFDLPIDGPLGGDPAKGKEGDHASEELDEEEEEGEEEKPPCEGPSNADRLREALANTPPLGPAGYVKCSVAPFNCKPNAGRITTWQKPGSTYTSVSCRCYYHANCSFAKSRKLATNHDLLCWLYSGLLDDSVTSAEEGDKAQKHVALGKSWTFIRVEAPSAPGSTAASSSAGVV